MRESGSSARKKDDKENFPYFIESNFRVEGRSEAQIRQLMSEWRRGFEITVHGGTFEAYLDATKTLRHDPFMIYKETIGRNPKARLTVKTFPDGNHNIHQSRTGGYREMLEILNSPKMSEGYYETILEWLRTHVLGADER